MRPIRAVLAMSPAVLLAVGVIACGDAASEPTEDAPQLEPILELRIGSVDDPEATLTWVRDMAVDRAGRVYTAHPQEHRVLIHDSDGRRVAAIGREGEGPGEFRSLGSIGFVGDTLWVYDYSLYRVSYLDADGALLGTHTIPIRTPRDAEDSPPRPQGMLPTGTLYGAPPAWSDDVASGDLNETPILRMDTTGAVLDTFMVRHHKNTVWALRDPDNPRRWASYSEQPYADGPMAILSKYEPVVYHVDRATTADAPDPRFRVTRRGYDGDTAYSRTYRYDPRPIQVTYSDSMIDWIAQRAADGPFPTGPTVEQARQWARDALYVPAHLPTVTEGLSGRDGTLWLQREPDQGGTRWLILDEYGEPIGTTALPPRVEPMAVQRDAFWGIETDDLDVPYLVRYRLDRPTRDAGVSP